MRLFKPTTLLFLSLTISCSSRPVPGLKETASYKQQIGRKLASLGDTKKIQKKVESLTEGIFHSYLLGQIYLQDFDRQLEQQPEDALQSETYSTLLAIRSTVDQFEHEINDLYLDLVMISAHPSSSPVQKLQAEVALRSIGNFLDGIRKDNKALPENLRPLILSNLREKQTELYEKLKVLHDDLSFTGDDSVVKDILHKNMVLLRATRMSYYKDLMNYQVNQEVFEYTLAEEKKKKSYQELRSNILKHSQEMRNFIRELGRGTSSNEITPSAGPNGNVTGRTFPARTWSLTFDDGPGKTTGQVVDNLLEKKLPATFFVQAACVEGLPKMAKKIKDSGFEIASHSYTHAQLTKVGDAKLEREIGTAKKVIEEKLGTMVKLFRLPYGAGVSVSKIRAKIAEHNMVHVFWNVDTLDWQDKNPQSIFERSVRQMRASSKNAGVILFHDIHRQSVIASALLMDYMNKENLNVCSVQKVIDQMNGNLSSCK